MTRLAIAALLLCAVLPHTATAQVPESADTLGAWEPVTSVQTYIDGDDTLKVIGDSTWVARQETITVGCDLGPNGSFWTFQPVPRTEKWLAKADTSLQYRDLQAMYECVHWVQDLYRIDAGFR